MAARLGLAMLISSLPVGARILQIERRETVDSKIRLFRREKVQEEREMRMELTMQLSKMSERVWWRR